LGLEKVVDGPRFEGDQLLNMYRVKNIEMLYKEKILFSAIPWVISPSTNKLIYANRLTDFWDGLGQAGYLNFGMAIVGYSLPDHDRYARQTVYALVRNYQQSYWDEEVFGLKKRPLVLVDYRPDKGSIEDYRSRYRFVDLSKSDLHMDGFNMDAIDKIFS
jgi:hypothetical protein